jgi:uncharacterized integral membrane protein
MIRTFVYILLWVLIMGIAIFATQNLTLVSIKLFTFESIRLPLGLVLVTWAGFGGVVATFWQVRSRANRQQFRDRKGTKRVKSSRAASPGSDRNPSSRTSQSQQTRRSSGDWEDDWIRGTEDDDWA